MSFLPEYVRWYYTKNFNYLLQNIRTIVLLAIHYFAIPYHIKTLFSPWKRQYMRATNNWNITELATSISFNLISRLVGAALRIILILCGFAVCTAIVFISIIGIILYLILSPFFIPYYLLEVDKKRISKAEKLADKHKNDQSILVQNILATDEGTFICEHVGLDPEKVSTYIKTVNEKGREALLSEQISNRKKVDPYISYGDLILILAHSYTPLIDILQKHEIQIKDIEEASVWYRDLVTFPKEKISIFNKDALLRISPLGKDWGYGFTPTLDKTSEEYVSLSHMFPRVVGRDKEINSLERILSKSTQNSIVVYGEPGVGRHAVVQALASMIQSGTVRPNLFDKRILLFDPRSLFLKGDEELNVQKTLTELLQEAENAGNVILVIDGLENYIHASKGKINFTDEFEKFLSNGKLQIIGITNTSSYFQFIQSNQTLTKLFDVLEVTPPSINEVESELKIAIIPVLEYKNDIVITLQALRETLKLTDQYVSKNPFPEKAIDLLNELIVYVKDEKKERYILPNHVRELITIKTKIPVGEIQSREKDLLTNLEDRLHESIINQEEAIKAIAKSLRRARTQVSQTNKPIGSFLFLGPTGVGKTETAKALARLYFGSEEKIIRFDMSQYQGEGVERLIGSLQLGHPGELLRKITDNPFALLLLDEIEKSDKKVLNLFLTLLDEGYVEDINGRRIDCKNLIIIATSNAAAELIRQNMLKGASGETLTKEVLGYVQEQHIFSPEFLNRFDDVVVFTPLSEGHLREVAKLMLKSLNTRLAKHDISVKITPELIRKLVSLGHDPVFGARAIRRTIADTIEDQVAQKIIKGDLKKGEEVEISI